MKILSLDPTFLLRPGEVHVWLFNLDDLEQDFLGYGQFLSYEEAQRSKRYRFEKDCQRFITRRGLLRKLLGRYCGMAPGEITYRPNSFGKPTLYPQPIRFNLSDCQNMVAFAFALEKDLGVDIEQVRLLPELARLAEHWFSPAEQTGMFMLADELQLDAFYHIWTQKEAFVKAHGEGLSLPLQDFSVSVDPNLPGGIQSIKDGAEEVSAWNMVTDVPAAGWRVAVCAQAEPKQDIQWYMPIGADFIST